MRTISLLAILPLRAMTQARPNSQGRDHREIMNNQARNAPSPSEAQWLTFDDTPLTTSMPAYTPLTTAVPIAAKPAVKGSGCKAQQVQAANYIQKQPDVVNFAQKQADRPPVQVSSEGIVSQEEMNEWLRVHDFARSQHGAGRLQWNETLAIGAKGNAVQCRGEHTAVNGENIHTNTIQLSPQKAVDAWMANAKYYNGIFQEQTAHFTQTIWKNTTSVGCYIQTCAPGTRYDVSYGTSWQATCRYYEAGNNLADGQFEANTQA